MCLPDLVFYAITFFLSGVLLASAKLSLGFITFLVLLIACAIQLVLLIPRINFIHKNLCTGQVGPEIKNRQTIKVLSFLILFAIAGAFYYSVFENYQLRNTNIVYDRKINFSGVVVDTLERGQNQRLVIELQKPYSGKILVKLKPYPEYKYGDLINFKGKIEKPEGDYASYLDKEEIYGISNFSQDNFMSSENGNTVKKFLISGKEKFVSNLEKVLPVEQAAFLSGLTLGERSEFSQEFKTQMANSGTTHLVALSGYNISILVLTISFLLGAVFSKRKTFWFTLLIIIGFVLMTGAQASVVRAGIMGGIILIAAQAQRVYSFKNAIAITAFLMVLENPKVLKFDLGFQLSFMALLGIIYLVPRIKELLKVNDEGFLAWKENLMTTSSAQLAVAPILIANFGSFSPVSLITNILILCAVPLTMGLGFVLGFLGFISYPLSLLFSWFVNLFLAYEILIIKIFGSLNIAQFKSISMIFTIVYYVALILFIIKPGFLRKIKNLKTLSGWRGVFQ